jgi:hypothetical protein
LTKPKRGFRLGTKGACEATLYEFTLRKEGATKETVLRRVAATTFREAVQHVTAALNDAEVVAVQVVGIVEMVSGSPLN